MPSNRKLCTCLPWALKNNVSLYQWDLEATQFYIAMYPSWLPSFDSNLVNISYL